MTTDSVSSSGLPQFALSLRAHGLRLAEANQFHVRVANPLNPSLTEHVRLSQGQYVTDYGYELGQLGEEAECADRVAYLLAVPRLDGDKA